MRLLKATTALVAAALVLAACTKPAPPDTTPPAVTLDAPAGGTTVELGTLVTLAGTASDAGGVAGVSILVDGVTVNTVVPTDGDWSYDWLPAAVGDYAVSAKATDRAGNSTTTDAITVSVTAAEVPATTGSVGGIISRVDLGPAALAASAAAAAAAKPAPIEAGQVFVTFKPGVRDVTFGANGAATAGAFTFKADGGFAFAGAEFVRDRAYPVASGLSLYRTDGLDEAGTRALVARLRTSPLVAEAFPNWILSAHAEPDDAYYPLQWSYPQLNLPEAWDSETGDTTHITVAVLDTGRYDHPDVQWAAGGANFANWNGAVPGEGTIADPDTIPGGSPHGTHVAGTIGAATNNSAGVAGVNWNVDVLPVKVLAANGSGNFAGIIEALFWVTGDDWVGYGGHVNDNIPRVINMSLGGNFETYCPDSLNGIFADLADIGIYTVVSAGNDSSPADVYFPANCPSVITVGATGPTALRASYSNFGPFVDVMAPGGDFYAIDPNGDVLDGILSTIDEEDFDFYQGTSMASPHVAGIVSLMLAQEPDLTLSQVRQRLHNASVPLTLGECGAPTLGLDGMNGCGAGLLDAAAALRGDVLTTPRAFAYAIANVDDAPVPVFYGDLAALDRLASYKTEATAEDDGSFSYSLDGLEPGTYQVIALELRSPETGVSSIDRIGWAYDVEVEAGAAAGADVSVVPMYLLLPTGQD
jgi:serine protease